MREKADVTFATTTPPTIAIPALLAKMFHCIPMISEVRDLCPEDFIAMGALRNPLAQWFARRLERIAYSQATKSVALSPGMADGVVRSGAAPGGVEVIPSGCGLYL